MQIFDHAENIEFVFFDFDGVFTDNSVITSQSGEESVRCSRFDGIGLQRLRQVGVGCMVVSTETNPVVAARCKKLAIKYFQGVEDKSNYIQKYCHNAGLDINLCAFLGNDINDLGALKLVGYPCIVADAHPSIMSEGFVATKTMGGQGAVRELCDALVMAREKKNA